MTQRREEPGRIPEFKSLDEEAEFWDTHSPLDFPEEFIEDTEVTMARPLGHILAVRLDAATIDHLAALGRKHGMGVSTFAAMWLRERLAQER